MKKIYLDHSATTRVDKKVLKEMLPYFRKDYGNPASLHSFGRQAIAGVDRARERVAAFLYCEPEEIVFTSGATEANNLAIKGFLTALGKKMEDIHLITTKIEHDSVLEPFKEMEKAGAAVTYLPVDSRGVISLSALEQAIREETVLISIMGVNNEVGSRQPIREAGQIIKRINEERASGQETGKGVEKIYFHSDATQSVGFFRNHVYRDHLDFLSFSGHKIYGPKGVGVLFVKKGSLLKPVQSGGHQESGLRSGTLNVPGIVGLGAAVSLLGEKAREKNNKKIAILRDRLVAGILKSVPNAVLNTPRGASTPAHAHFSFIGAEGESVLIALDLAGISVSTGSACASGSLEPSHVLLAMGIKKEIAHNSIRFTLGKETTAGEINKIIKTLPLIIERLRRISPIKAN